MKLGEQHNVIKNNDLPETVRLAILASGGGSNAAQIIRHFKGHPHINVALVATNRPGAGVVEIAASENIPILVLNKEQFFGGDGYVSFLKEEKINFLVLAGFLWKVPLSLINAFKGKIINIHPALLPRFGGKGMYGQHVHQAVLEAGEKESGITVHYVDELYDHGAVIFQATCPVLAEDTAQSLAQRVLALEHHFYPLVIEDLVQQKNVV